jgi:hypothetical protein
MRISRLTPWDFVHAPFGIVLARVRGAIQATVIPLARIDGPPPLYGGCWIFLLDVANPLEP